MREFAKEILISFKSPVVWASLGSVILWGLKTSGKLEAFGMDADSFNTGWNLMVGLLVSVGIIYSPSNKRNF